MKRRISLLLAVVMILGTFSFAFAADVNDKVDLVTKEGILRGDQGTNALRLDDPLARKEAVVLLSRLMDVEEEANNFEKEGLPTFADVQDAVYYKSFIAWAEDNKYFDGNPDGTFGFNDNLTVKQYAAVLLRALGYAEEVYNVEGWKNVEKLANDLNLLEDVETELNGDATREEVAVMTFNALGAKMKDSDKTLAEFLGIEMPVEKPEKLEAKVNDTENLKEVVLELSNAELVDKDKLVNVNNYKVVGNVVEKVELEGDNVIVLLQNPLLEGREYKLRVRSIDKAINKEYKFKAKDNTIPSVENVEVLGKYGIKLRTSEPISLKDGDRGRSFEVDGKNIAMNVEVYGRDVILTPYYNESFSKDVKTLTVSGLADFAGFRSAREAFEIEMVEDEVAPKVEDVILRGDKKVEVVFDKDIYIESVEDYYDKNNLGNISYQSGRHTVYAENATKIDTNKVLYEFKDEFLRVRTDFTIVDVENHSGVKMEKTTMVAREILDDAEPEIFDHAIVAKDIDAGTATMRLYFDKDVDFFVKDGKLDTDEHFTLYEREVYKRNVSEKAKVSKAYYGLNREDVIDVELTGLTVWTMENELDYILEVENFTDQASKRNRMFRDYIEFKFQPSTGFNIATDGIEVDERTYETEITIKFNKPVDRVIAEDFKNYIFTNIDGVRKDVKDLKGRIVTERRGYEVSIILPDFKVKDYDNFRILDTLKNTSGQRLDKVYVYNFETGFAENEKYTITKDADGDFVVTPNEGVEEITLKTDVKGNFIVDNTGKDLKKLVINAPNADVVVKGDIDEVVIEAIKGETLTIEGTVETVTVKTEKLVSIKATDTVFELVSKVEKANVKVNSTEVKLEKGKDVKVTVDKDGEVTPETVENIELEETKEELQTEIDKATGLVKDLDKLENAKVLLQAEILKAEKVLEDATLEEVKSALKNLKDAVKAAEEALLADFEEKLQDLNITLNYVKQGKEDEYQNVSIGWSDIDSPLLDLPAKEVLESLVVELLDDEGNVLAKSELRLDKYSGTVKGATPAAFHYWGFERTADKYPISWDRSAYKNGFEDGEYDAKKTPEGFKKASKAIVIIKPIAGTEVQATTK